MPWKIKNRREQAEHVFFVAMTNSVYAGDGEICYADYDEFLNLVSKPTLTSVEQATLDELLALLSPKDAGTVRRLLEAYAAKKAKAGR